MLKPWFPTISQVLQEARLCLPPLPGTDTQDYGHTPGFLVSRSTSLWLHLRILSQKHLSKTRTLHPFILTRRAESWAGKGDGHCAARAARVRRASGRKKPVFNGAGPPWKRGRGGVRRGRQGGRKQGIWAEQTEWVHFNLLCWGRQKEFPAAEPGQSCVLGGSGLSHSQLGKVP